ncbi:hypothetical protein DSECCO2_474390 [anaerobic digester metagenome]
MEFIGIRPERQGTFTSFHGTADVALSCRQLKVGNHLPDQAAWIGLLYVQGLLALLQFAELHDLEHQLLQFQAVVVYFKQAWVFGSKLLVLDQCMNV